MYFLHRTEQESSNLRHDYHSTSRNEINPHGHSKKKPQVQCSKRRVQKECCHSAEKNSKWKPINVKDGKVTNFPILATRQQNSVGNKGTMPHKIIDLVNTGGLQNFDRYDKLSPVEISVRDSRVITYLSRYQRYKYWFIIDNLLFNSVPTNHTNLTRLKSLR